MDSGTVPIEDAVRSYSDRTIVRFHVTSGSSRSRLAEYDPWRTSIKVMVKSPAKKNEANEELISLLSKSFGIEESRLEIVSGRKNRYKNISIIGIGREEVLRLLSRVLGDE